MATDIPRIPRPLAEQYPQLAEILAAAKFSALETLLTGKKVARVEHIKAADRMAPAGTANYHFCKIELVGDELVFVLVVPQKVTVAHFDGKETLRFIASDGHTQEFRGDAQALKEYEQACLRALPPQRIT